MKSFLIVLLIPFSFNSFGQTQKTGKLKLTIGNCNNAYPYSWIRADTVKFYKLPEEILSFIIIPRKYNVSPIELNNIPIAEYRIKYKNRFKEEFIKEIVVKENYENDVTLCIDTLQSYIQNTLLKLQNNDSISIKFESQGCFHHNFMKIVVLKNNDSFIAKLYNHSNSSPAKTITLTGANISQFTRFENELNFVTDGGCTTTDWYNIESKYLNIKKTDRSCNWDGFFFLRKSFFGELENDK